MIYIFPGANPYLRRDLFFPGGVTSQTKIHQNIKYESLQNLVAPPGHQNKKKSCQKHEILVLANPRITSKNGGYTTRKTFPPLFPLKNWSSYIAIGESFTVIRYIPSMLLDIMIILDQDLFSIEVILSISAILRPLTTSDEDGLRIGLSRIPEFRWKVPQNDLRSLNSNLRKENTIPVRSPFLLLRGPLIKSTHFK